MRTAKIVCLAIYTALASGANSIIAAERPTDWVNFRVTEPAKSAPATEFETIDGTKMTVADLVKNAPDGKVFVMNFWATWCAPCRAEMPSLDRLQTDASDAEVEVVTIATGRNPPPMLIRFFEREGIENLPPHRDPTGALAKAYDILGLPVTILLNAKGEEIARMQGEAEWGTPQAIAFLTALN